MLLYKICCIFIAVCCSVGRHTQNINKKKRHQCFKANFSIYKRSITGLHVTARFLFLLFQEFPEKTRPVSFKHPSFQCPDMSPSPSVPSSGVPRSRLQTSHRCVVKELELSWVQPPQSLFFSPLPSLSLSHLSPFWSSGICEGGRYQSHRRLGGLSDSRCYLLFVASSAAPMIQCNTEPK